MGLKGHVGFKWLSLHLSVSERFNLPHFLSSIYNSVIVLLHFDSTRWSHLHTPGHTPTRTVTHIFLHTSMREWCQQILIKCLSNEWNKWLQQVSQWLGIWQRAIPELLHVLMDQLKAMWIPLYLPRLPARSFSVPGVIRGSLPADSWAHSGRHTALWHTVTRNTEWEATGMISINAQNSGIWSLCYSAWGGLNRRKVLQLEGPADHSSLFVMSFMKMKIFDFL